MFFFRKKQSATVISFCPAVKCKKMPTNTYR